MRILNGTLSFYECRLSGVAIQRLWGHSNPTCCNQFFCLLSPIEPPCETFTIFKLMIITAPKPVWGKVIFLHMSIMLSTGGRGLYMMSVPVWLPGPMFPGGFCLWSNVPSRGSLSRGRGSLSRGSLSGRSHPVGEEWAIRIQLERMLV